MVDSDIIDVDGIGLPSVLARFEVQRARSVLLATHAVPPVSAEDARWRNDQLAAIPRIGRR